MIGAVLPPTPGDVVLGIGAVIVGALIAATSAFLARRTRNWLHHLGTVGGLLIVAGVVGQRTPGVGTALGPWDAGITIPVIGVRIDPVAAAGIVVALLGVVLTLLLERVPQPGEGPGALIHRPLEEDDAI